MPSIRLQKINASIDVDILTRMDQMRIDLNLLTGQKLIGLDINTDFDPHSSLYFNHHDHYFGDAYLLRVKWVQTSGLCLIESSCMEIHEEQIQLSVNQPHILFSFISNTPNENVDTHSPQGSLSGKVHIRFNDRDGKYVNPIGGPGQSFYILMSKPYYLNIFQNETFSNYFDLYQCVQQNIPFASSEEELSFSLPMKSILRKAFNNPFRDAMKKYYIEAKIKGLMSLLQEERMRKMSAPTPFIREDIMEKIYQAKSILDNNYQTPPTIPQLSRMIVLNEKDLKTQFKTLFGLTIRNYLVKLRMKAAYSLINDKNVMVFEVALRLGYKDTSHFINMFKKYFGYTPKYFCKHIKINQMVLSFLSLGELLGFALFDNVF